jgi:hypothetical protein
MHLTNAYNANAAAAVSTEAKIEKEQMDNEMVMLNKQTNNGDVGQLIAKANAIKGKSDPASIRTMRAITELAGKDKFKAQQFSRDVYGDSSLSEGMRAAVAKQMTTGDGAKNFRAGDAFAFQHASDVNAGAAPGNFDVSWKQNNAEDVIDRHIDTAEDLNSQGSHVLRFLSGDDGEGGINGAAYAKVKRVARQATAKEAAGGMSINNAKKTTIYKLANRQ